MRIVLLCIAVLVAVSGCGRHRSAQTSTQTAPSAAALTTDLIARTPDDKLVQLITDHVFEAIGDDWDKKRTTIDAMPRGCGMIDAITLLDGEVNNGGFAQYFVNTEGESAELALEGYAKIVAPKHADLLREATGIALKELESDLGKQAKTDMKAFSRYCRTNSLSALDDRYYEMEKSEDVYKLMARYIRSHPKDFAER